MKLYKFLNEVQRIIQRNEDMKELEQIKKAVDTFKLERPIEKQKKIKDLKDADISRQSHI